MTLVSSQQNFRGLITFLHKESIFYFLSLQFPALLNLCFPEPDSNQGQSLWDVFIGYLKRGNKLQFLPYFFPLEKINIPLPCLILKLKQNFWFLQRQKTGTDCWLPSPKSNKEEASREHEFQELMTWTIRDLWRGGNGTADRGGGRWAGQSPEQKTGWQKWVSENKFTFPPTSSLLCCEAIIAALSTLNFRLIYPKLSTNNSPQMSNRHLKQNASSTKQDLDTPPKTCSFCCLSHYTK